LCALIALGAAACREEQTPPNETPTEAKQPDQQQQAAILAKLEMADKADGTEDKTVHKCLMCALAMDGREEHKVDFRGYTLLLCSEHCLERFSKDPAKSVLELEPFDPGPS
jgi:YHS domain-containing protein